ncbi:hypothetical protein [Bacteroides faecium]|uniref:Uncharacterized protein n=1 Tax=Bacteroides faecium TaxID=2715212 RepID=A0A6H0KHP5_9BACE|nr:hypothetical protein [Bacteroides faecium]QIU92805.1 hypothetical protein BacF7301_00925 [Bacteroides faecium]
MNHLLGQGHTMIAHTGDTLVNAGTTICGLVLAFTNTSNEVACYHLPYMDCSRVHLSKLMDIVGRIGPISRIIIISNDFLNEEDRIRCTMAVRQIKELFGVQTNYYIQSEVLVGSIYVRLIHRDIDILGTLREVSY